MFKVLRIILTTFIILQIALAQEEEEHEPVPAGKPIPNGNPFHGKPKPDNYGQFKFDDDGSSSSFFGSSYPEAVQTAEPVEAKSIHVQTKEAVDSIYVKEKQPLPEVPAVAPAQPVKAEPVSAPKVDINAPAKPNPPDPAQQSSKVQKTPNFEIMSNDKKKEILKVQHKGMPAAAPANEATKPDPDSLLTPEQLQAKWYADQMSKNLASQQSQINQTIALLKKKYSYINEELKNTNAKNPNLNDINFKLLNTTNHLIIDLSLSKDMQAKMANGDDESKDDEAEDQEDEEETEVMVNGTKVIRKKASPKTFYDPNQQAVQCMLQDISYICVGKGIRKCCSNDAVSDPQCINTEDYYNGQQLSIYDEYSDNEQVYQGKNAVFLQSGTQSSKPVEEQAEPEEEEGVDPDTVYKGETRAQIQFEKSQILKKNGPLTHPNNVLCSDTLRDDVSFYAQFELAPTFTEVCGPRYLNTSMSEQYIHNTDNIKKKGGQFTKYSVCVYEIYNPYPQHTLYLNLYRLTNNSDVGIYYQKGKDMDQASARREKLLPKGTKEAIKDYIPGEWTNMTKIQESEETKNIFNTFKIQYPARSDFYYDMSKHMKEVGAPYHNVTDIMRQYAFEGVDKINIVVIGQSQKSQFDFGLQVGVFTTVNTKYFNDNWPYMALCCLIGLLVYFFILSIIYGVKSHRKYQEFV